MSSSFFLTTLPHNRERAASGRVVKFNELGKCNFFMSQGVYCMRAGYHVEKVMVFTEVLRNLQIELEQDMPN